MDPVKVGEGTVPAGLTRRVIVSVVVGGKATLAIIGSRDHDVLTYAEVGGGTFNLKNEIDLPGRDGTMPDAVTDIWQDGVGRVFRGLDWFNSVWLLADAIR